MYIGMSPSLLFLFFFFNDTAPTEIYPLPLHDALPILRVDQVAPHQRAHQFPAAEDHDVLFEPLLEVGDRGDGITAEQGRVLDRKSTRLNSSHGYISYAVFCLKKKKNLR